MDRTSTRYVRGRLARQLSGAAPAVWALLLLAVSAASFAGMSRNEQISEIVASLCRLPHVASTAAAEGGPLIPSGDYVGSTACQR